MRWASALVAATLATIVAAQAKCDVDNKCPESQPCCSQYGQCGVGAYCLGGCDPLSSYSLEACMPNPVCQSSNYKLSSLDDIVSNTKYLGDASQANWVSEGTPMVYDDSILLTMAPNTIGTLLSSTHYVWYGKISTTMRSSVGQGVVTAFIMMSDVKDEIDFEFIGADTQNVQSNFYWQGALNYTNELNLTSANTNSQTHTYTVDWNPEQLTWSVDDKVMRTLRKADTYNSSTGQYDYPQTPARVQLSLWPAGSPGEGLGTINWAGGLIDWNSPDMTNGYYSAQVFSVDVECYDPPSDAAGTSGSKSYVYTDKSAGYENCVEITNDNTVMGSLLDSGLNPNANKPAKSTSAGAPMQTVPGSSGIGGAEGDNGSSGGSQSGTGSGGSAGGGMNGQFSQGLDSSSGSSNGASFSGNDEAKKGSAFAVLVALVALIAL